MAQAMWAMITPSARRPSSNRERPQRVLTRDQLLDFARGPETEAYDRAIDVQISRLRKKLDDGSGGQELIRTIRNEGYVFTAKVTRG